MDNYENIQNGMEVYSGDQFIGYVEEAKKNSIRVNGQKINDDQIARIEQNRIFLRGTDYAVSQNYQQGQQVSGQHTEGQLNEQGEMRVPIVEERLNVGKQEVQLGEVGLQKRVTEQQQTIPVELRREDVYVEQHATQERPLQAGELDRAFQEETIRVPVRGEQAIVGKEAVVTGEVVVRKEERTEQQQVAGTVRRVEVQVDKNYQQVRSHFQQDWQQNYASSGRTFEQDEPYYQYGYAAGRNQQYAGRNFTDVEPELHRNYDQQYGNTDDRWEQLREAVRHGYEGSRTTGNQ